MALSWLPDGSHLVVVEGNRSVWIVPRLGGTARRLRDSGRMAAPSPDGTALALTTDDFVGFHTLSLAGGETRVVSLTGFGRVLAIDWHARTNRVVLMTPGDDEKVWNVWSVASDGRDQLRLLTGTEFNRAICSSPVSDVVYVMRDHRGSMDLLRVPMYPDPGAVRVLLTGLPVTPMGYPMHGVGRRPAAALFTQRQGFQPLATELRTIDDGGDAADPWRRGLLASRRVSGWAVDRGHSRFRLRFADRQSSDRRRRAGTPWRRSRTSLVARRTAAGLHLSPQRVPASLDLWGERPVAQRG